MPLVFIDRDTADEPVPSQARIARLLLEDDLEDEPTPTPKPELEHILAPT